MTELRECIRQAPSLSVDVKTIVLLNTISEFLNPAITCDGAPSSRSTALKTKRHLAVTTFPTASKYYEKC